MISLKKFIDADINEIYINESSCNAKKKNKTSVEDADEKEKKE